MHTLRRFPAPSRRASNPPGPMLLLLNFLEGFAAGTALFAPVREPISVVIFS